MTQNAQPPMPGQMDTPNPIELFWEKNRKPTLIVLGILALALAGWSLKKKMDRDAVNEDWSTFSVASAFDKAYAEMPEGWSEALETAQSMGAQNPQFADMAIGNALMSARRRLVDKLGSDLQTADRATLTELAKGKDGRAPLALWLLAGADRAAEEWDSALGHLAELEKRFPEHVLCTETPHPVQFQPTVPEEDEDEDEAANRRNEEPEYEPAVAGSAVAMMRQSIEDGRKFRAEHAEFYMAPEPTSEQTIVFEFEELGEVAFKLYDQAAPQHAAKLLEMAGADGGWWKGMAVHELVRREAGVGAFGMRQSETGEFVIGWSTTKDQDDPEQWKESDVEEEHQVEWEDTGISHFPGMVAVLPGKEDKSQVERLVFNSVDMATEADGRRVVVGRVVRGLELIEEIVASSFLKTEDQTRGRGAPLTTFRVTGVRVE